MASVSSTIDVNPSDRMLRLRTLELALNLPNSKPIADRFDDLWKLVSGTEKETTDKPFAMAVDSPHIGRIDPSGLIFDSCSAAHPDGTIRPIPDAPKEPHVRTLCELKAELIDLCRAIDTLRG